MRTKEIMGYVVEIDENATHEWYAHCGEWGSDCGHCRNFVVLAHRRELPDWGESYCCHEPYPYGAPGFPEPHFDLEFWVTLPWVLDEPLE